MTTELPVILMADDSENDTELVLEALTESKLANRVVIARNGVEALDFLFRRGKFSEYKGPNPALFLLDIKMPKLNGLDVLRRMRDVPEFANIPVVVLSSSREEADLKEARRLGAVAYIVKPVGFEDFMEATKIAGRFWGILNAFSEIESRETRARNTT